MKKRNILLFALVGLMAVYSCEKEEIEVNPENPSNEDSGNNENNDDENSGDTPSQELIDLNPNTFVMKDSASGDETTYEFNYFKVRSTNNDKSTHIYVRENETDFPSGNSFLLVLTEGENKPFLSPTNKTYDFRTIYAGATYPEPDEWQFKLCPSGGIADQGYDCYTYETEGYEMISKTKLFYERSGDTYTFMFENHKVDNKTFTGKVEITNAEIGNPDYDGLDVLGSL